MKRWLVAVGSSIGLATGFGPIFINNFGLFQKPIIAEMGWSRAEVALGFSLATLVAAILVPFTGGWLDRKGVRPIVLAGVFLLAAALVAFSFAHSYAAYLGAAVIMGLVGATTSYPTYISILPRRFTKRLGLALSIATSGVGYGSIIMTLYITALIASFGWRRALLILAATVLPLGLLNLAIFLRDADKADVEGAALVAAEDTAPSLPFDQIVRRVDFWALTFAFGAVVMVTIGINFQFAALLTDRGGTPQLVAEVLSVSFFSVLFARVSAGAVMDYVPPRLVGMILFGAQAIGAFILASGVHSGAMLFTAAILGGLTNGGEGSLMPYMLSRKFGKRAYGRVYGTCFAIFNLGTLTGPFLMGLCFDRLHTYTPMLFAFVGVSVTSALIIVVAGSIKPGELAAQQA